MLCFHELDITVILHHFLKTLCAILYHSSNVFAVLIVFLIFTYFYYFLFLCNTFNEKILHVRAHNTYGYICVYNYVGNGKC